jgi:hypothetical protein
MPTIALAMPIPPHNYETWRAAVTSFAGERRSEYDASRRRLGVQRSTSWVQQTPQGPIEILVVEAADPARFFEGLATSQEPFDVEFRAFIQDVYGLDLTQPLPVPLPELVLDWSATPTTTPV